MINKKLAFFADQMRIGMQAMIEYNKLISKIANADRPIDQLDESEAAILCKMLEAINRELTSLSLISYKAMDELKETQSVNKDEFAPF